MLSQLDTWSCGDVQEWVRDNLPEPDEKVVQAFAERKIDGPALRKINKEAIGTEYHVGANNLKIFKGRLDGLQKTVCTRLFVLSLPHRCPKPRSPHCFV